MGLSINDLDVVRDQALPDRDEQEQAFTVYISATEEGIGRIVVYPDGNVSARDMSGMSRQDGFRTANDAARYLIGVHER